MLGYVNGWGYLRRDYRISGEHPSERELVRGVGFQFDYSDFIGKSSVRLDGSDRRNYAEHFVAEHVFPRSDESRSEKSFAFAVLDVLKESGCGQRHGINVSLASSVRGNHQRAVTA